MGMNTTGKHQRGNVFCGEKKEGTSAAAGGHFRGRGSVPPTRPPSLFSMCLKFFAFTSLQRGALATPHDGGYWRWDLRACRR
jgi:hypothetical protein